MIKPNVYFLAAVLILVPFIDSVFVPTAFAVQWRNEQTMYLLQAYLMPIKLFMVLFGGYLLVRKKQLSEELQSNAFHKKVFDVGLFVLAGLQSIILIVICSLYIVVGTNADNYQLRGNISVYTVDSNVLGEATHYFSYQCTDNQGFYTLTPIVTLAWLGHFSFISKNNTLLIEHNDYTAKGKQFKQIDLSMFGCPKTH